VRLVRNRATLLPCFRYKVCLDPTRIIHLLFLSRPGNHDLAAASGVLLRRRCFTKSVTRASVSPVDWSMSLSLGCTARGSERRKHRIGGSDCRLLNVAPINHHGKGSMKP